MKDKELLKLYNTAKIRYNPLDYTLSDRLLESKAILPKIIRVDYATEEELLNTINKNTKGGKGMSTHDFLTTLATVTVEKRLAWVKDTNFNAAEVSLIMNYRNNLTVETLSFLNMMAIIYKKGDFVSLSKSDKDFIKDMYENSNCVEAFVTLNIALRAKTSVLPVLKYAVYPNYLSYTYEELCNGKHILDGLTSDKDVNIPLGFTDLRDMTMCVNNTRKKILEVLSDEDKKHACVISALHTVLYGIEILHAIESIKDERIRESLYSMLAVDYNKHCIANMLYHVESGKVIINEDILNIISKADNRIRFKEISLYLSNSEILRSIVDIGELMATDADIYGAPIALAMMVNFCIEYNLQSIRTTNILVLLAYIKTNGWRLNADRDYDDDDEDDPLDKDTLKDTFGIDIDDDSATDIFSKEDDTAINNSMLDLHTHDKGGIPGIPKASKFKKTPTLEALDKEMSSFTDGMFGYKVRDIIDSSSRYKDRYNAIVEGVSLLNKNLIRKIKEIKVYNEGGKNPGLTSGKLDMKNIWKYKITDKIFCRNTYKIKESDLAFGIILDVSGSMEGKGIENGKITMIILHETLKALNINHSIITHTEHEGYHTCDIKRYQNFREQKTYAVRKNYALAGITAESGNCDAAALKYMETAFEKVRNRDKICLIFSDGEPTECSDSELVDQIKHMERKGIKVIGIGVNFDNIKEYYKDYANGKNLKEMLDIVSDILKQYILDKKE